MKTLASLLMESSRWAEKAGREAEAGLLEDARASANRARALLQSVVHDIEQSSYEPQSQRRKKAITNPRTGLRKYRDPLVREGTYATPKRIAKARDFVEQYWKSVRSGVCDTCGSRRPLNDQGTCEECVVDAVAHGGDL